MARLPLETTRLIVEATSYITIRYTDIAACAQLCHLTLSGPSFFQLLSSQGQIFLGLESVLQPALHFVNYLKEYLMDHVEIFRKHTLHILQHKDVINDDVTRSCDW